MILPEPSPKLRHPYSQRDSGFELLDVSSSLETLIRRPGLTCWRPAVNRDVDVGHENYSSYLSTLQNGAGKSKLSATHWPPDNAKELNLERWCAIGVYFPFGVEKY